MGNPMLDRSKVNHLVRMLIREIEPQITWLRIAVANRPAEALREVEFKAFLTWTLINLNDALSLLDSDDRRVSDTGENIEKHGKEGDLTSLIRAARNVVCHIQSPLSKMGKIVFVRWAFLMEGSQFLLTPDSVAPIIPAGDCAIMFGDIHILFNHNIELAINRVKAPAPDPWME